MMLRYLTIVVGVLAALGMLAWAVFTAFTALYRPALSSAIADSYVHYLRTANGPGAAHAAVLDSAVRATGTPLPRRLLGTAGLCALLVVLAGARGALVIGRGRRRVSWQ